MSQSIPKILVYTGDKNKLVNPSYEFKISARLFNFQEDVDVTYFYNSTYEPEALYPELKYSLYYNSTCSAKDIILERQNDKPFLDNFKDSF